MEKCAMITKNPSQSAVNMSSPDAIKAEDETHVGPYEQSNNASSISAHLLPRPAETSGYAVSNENRSQEKACSDYGVSSVENSKSKALEAAMPQSKSTEPPQEVLIKTETQSPTKIAPFPHAVGMRPANGAGSVRLEQKTPKKIVRLYNRPSRGHQTSVIMAQGQSRKPTFVCDGAKASSTTNFTRLNDMLAASVHASGCSTSTVRPPRYFKEEPSSPPGSPAKSHLLPIHRHEQQSHIEQRTQEHMVAVPPPQYKHARGVNRPPKAASLAGTDTTSVTCGASAALGAPVNSMSQAGIVTCPTVYSQALMNTASSSTSVPSYVPASHISHVTAHPSSMTNRQTIATPPVIHRIILASSTTPSTVQRPPDESLTNIQWLRRMSNPKLPVEVTASDKCTKKCGHECEAKKRPSYSYMHLIQMAISSNIDKRMTLREIYKWIEDKFPYYQYTLKQGWKNSIRHNLSLYNIFVREKPYTPGKSGTSYWTLRADLSDKTTKTVRYTPLDTHNKRDKGKKSKLPADAVGQGCNARKIYTVSSKSSKLSKSSTPKQNVPNIFKHRKGPAPLLPKPPVLSAALPTFALIPIPPGVAVVPPQPVVLSSWPVATSTACSQGPLTPAAPGAIQHLSSSKLNTSSRLKRTQAPSVDVGPPRKHVRIAPKVSALDNSVHCRSHGTIELASSLDTTDVHAHLSHLHVDSGIASDISSSCESPSILEQPSPSLHGLPKPIVYRNKRSRKDKVVVLRDCDEEINMGAVASRGSSKENRPVRILSKSSARVLDLKSSPGGMGQERQVTLNESAFYESGLNNWIANMENEFSSPMKGLLTTPPKSDDKQRLCALRPSSGTLLSPSWISPIKNVTPLSHDARDIDSGFFTPDEKLTSTPNGCSRKSRTGHRGPGRTGLRSPRLGSLRDLGLPGLTPLKSSSLSCAVRDDSGAQAVGHSSPDTSLLSNQSFQHLLGDLNLDSIMDDGVVDLANLSFLQC